MLGRRLFVIALLFVACGSDASEATGIELLSRSFSPDTFKVKVGEAVTWRNQGPDTHTVTAYSSGLPLGADYFASGGAPDEETARDEVTDGLVRPGETFRVTFEVPGTYKYFCIPHESEGMVARIVVEE